MIDNEQAQEVYNRIRRRDLPFLHQSRHNPYLQFDEDEIYFTDNVDLYLSDLQTVADLVEGHSLTDFELSRIIPFLNKAVDVFTKVVNYDAFESASKTRHEAEKQRFTNSAIRKIDNSLAPSLSQGIPSSIQIEESED